MIQNIELYTADGKLVETVQDPIVGMMGANGKPPEVLVWGERVFVLAAPDAYRPGAIRYREGMAWALRLGQEATAMPSPRVDGALAGLTLLPVSTGAPDPRAETTDSDIPGAEKMTESYKPPEDETPGAARYVELAKILADLDRCMHGRHRADSCFDCAERRSAGNHQLPAAGAVVGYDYGGRPYVVPAEGRSFSDPEAWRS